MCTLYPSHDDIKLVLSRFHLAQKSTAFFSLFDLSEMPYLSHLAAHCWIHPIQELFHEVLTGLLDIKIATIYCLLGQIFPIFVVPLLLHWVKSFNVHRHTFAAVLILFLQVSLSLIFLVIVKHTARRQNFYRQIR